MRSFSAGRHTQRSTPPLNQYTSFEQDCVFKFFTSENGWGTLKKIIFSGKIS